MKKYLTVSLIAVLMLIMSGCSENQVNSERTQKISTHKEEVDIGKKIYENDSYDYIYGGIVNNSIVINVYYDVSGFENSMPFYIPLTRVDAVKLPFDEKATITISKFDIDNGKATLIVSENK